MRKRHWAALAMQGSATRDGTVSSRNRHRHSQKSGSQMTEKTFSSCKTRQLSRKVYSTVTDQAFSSWQICHPSVKPRMSISVRHKGCNFSEG